MAKIIKKNRGSDLTITKEQEAIEYIKKRIKVCNENADVCDDNDFDEEATYLREESYMLETVLSMIKEKDRQIDLMAEFISKQDVEEEICIKNKTNPDWCNEDYTNCKDCIKQYFERKSK